MHRALAATGNTTRRTIFELLSSGKGYMIGRLESEWQDPLKNLLYRTALVRVHPRVWEVGELRGILLKSRV